jgi:peptidoglycan/xylan/chitin deacetylase (PgdA/CDA1 family)
MALVLAIVAVWSPWSVFVQGPDVGAPPFGVMVLVPTHQRAVALTFDDGPSPRTTTKILSLLMSFHDQATFFILGSQAAKYPKLTQLIVKDGMELGNHTYGHINLTQHSLTQDVADLTRTNHIIQQLTHRTPHWLRPPYGAYSTKVLHAAAECGLHLVLWTPGFVPVENQDPSQLVSNVVKHLAPGEIIPLPESGPRVAEEMGALFILLHDLKTLGYRSVTVSALARMH